MQETKTIKTIYSDDSLLELSEIMDSQRSRIRIYNSKKDYEIHFDIVHDDLWELHYKIGNFLSRKGFRV